jgi:hypothetical protein
MRIYVVCVASYALCNPPFPLSRAQGPVHTALTVAREEGVMKLWSGATATTIRQGSNQMSLFWGKSVVDRALWDKQVGWVGHRWAGPTAIIWGGRS